MLSESQACLPVPISSKNFNPAAVLPYGFITEHLRKAMQEFLDFLGFINQQLHGKGLQRLESMLMPANFSSMVGEFVMSAIPKHCTNLVRNAYHNGHPDLLPKGAFPQDAAQHGGQGIEIKGSRYDRGWQGHNKEACWLMVVVFDSNRPVDTLNGLAPRKFRFRAVYLGELQTNDWKFSDRSEKSRRTITAG